MEIISNDYLHCQTKKKAERYLYEKDSDELHRRENQLQAELKNAGVSGSALMWLTDFFGIWNYLRSRTNLQLNLGLSRRYLPRHTRYDLSTYPIPIS